MNKKGFTLIEVMGAIVVLGVIAVIIVPKVNKTINSSKEKTYKLSAEALIDGLENYAMDIKQMMVPFNGCGVDFTTNTTTCENFSFSGKKPDSGYISVDENGMVNGGVTFSNKQYCIHDSNFVSSCVGGLELVHGPIKSIYGLGEEISTEGIVVKAKYYDGRELVISDYDILSYDNNSVGNETIYLQYDGKMVDFEVEFANILYLYKNGNEYSNVTGGWNNSIGVRTSAWCNYNSSLNSNHILFEEKYCNDKWSQSAARTKNMLDFYNYDEIVLKVQADGLIDYGLILQFSTSTNFDNTSESNVFNKRYITTLDPVYVKFNLNNVEKKNNYFKISLITRPESPRLEENTLKLYEVYLVKR